MEHQLKHPYIRVEKDGSCAYGGRQQWSGRWDLRQCGCGAVAMTDLTLYLTRYHGCSGPAEAALDPLPLADYDRLCAKLQRTYLPMLPPFGINGLSLAAGISLYCKARGIPLRARWGVRAREFWTVMADMLDRDLPVIVSVGQIIPKFWQNKRLNLYRRTGEGVYTAVSAVRAHYVAVTAMDDTWLTVSSWGKQFYIHRGEYEQFGREHSLALIHNLVRLEPQKGT